MSTFNVICSFDELEQAFFDIQAPSGVAEDTFVESVLAELSPSELSELVKISSCQLGATTSTAEPWLLARNGKFFFNTDVNTDVDTRLWAEIKARAIERRSTSGAKKNVSP